MLIKNLIMKKIIIAIDGFSSCGKSTMAKDLARKIGYVYIDSGAMYRATTLFALQRGYIREGKLDAAALEANLAELHIEFRLNPETMLPETYLNGINVEKAIRTMEVSGFVSPVSALPFVRHAMVRQQQQMGEAKGIVMDGRDIGTTVFPDAELKIFVTASAEVRAQRRVDELTAKGESVSFEEVLDNVKTRDHIDQTREESPLRKADDALLLDNSNLTIAQQDAWLMEEFNRVVCR
ncbi:MAG: (d)CMP kinase [Bacteroidales bacterium]